jgi:hypothetical protein
MAVPVFVSAPSALSKVQRAVHDDFLNLLHEYGLDPRTLGRSDYAIDTPLREVIALARRCSGGVILGFSQLAVRSAIERPGSEEEREISGRLLATPWNQIEAGVLGALRLPLLVLKEEGVEGGVFDLGSTDLFVHTLTPASLNREALVQVTLRWHSRVLADFYNDLPKILDCLGLQRLEDDIPALLAHGS